MRLITPSLVLISACAGATPAQPPLARVEIGPAPVPAAASAASIEPPPASPDDPAPAAKPVLLHFDIWNASTTYDFSLSLDEDCSSDKAPMGVCEAPGNLVVFLKGSDVPLQRVPLESIDVITADNGEPLVNTSPMYDYQGTIEVGDFDFDGHEDFAVQDSEQGPYGGPTFQVFLYQQRGVQGRPRRPGHGLAVHRGRDGRGRRRRDDRGASWRQVDQEGGHDSTNALRRSMAASHRAEMRSRHSRAASSRSGSISQTLSLPARRPRTTPASASTRRCLATACRVTSASSVSFTID